ncbi:MAG TPA: hypothetical protein VNR87_01655 [Flavisolibacter sp.]|nr:hypothetical protein [Flavisolibacter sp.]
MASVYNGTNSFFGLVYFFKAIPRSMYNYSPEDLILFLYKETSPDVTAAIEKALQEDWSLREKLAVLKTSMERLNSITVSPRTEVVLNILAHARKEEKVTK